MTKHFKCTLRTSCIKEGKEKVISGVARWTCVTLYVMYLFPCRVKALKEPVYSQHEADQAAGMGSYVVPAPPILESSDKPRAMEMEQTMRQGVSELAI